ncbi:unnamed protein product, partial [Closterium sp. Naga37s-1]
MAAVSAATARVAMAAAPVQSAVLASSYSSRSSFAAGPVSRPSRAAGAKRLPAGIRCHGEESEAAVDGRAFRRALNKSDNYNRSGFGYKKEMLERMEQEYTSDVVKTLRENNNEYTWGDVTVMLAESLGFCWGVERAVQMAYEARKQFPDQKIWVTNEIIQQPHRQRRACHPPSPPSLLPGNLTARRHVSCVLALHSRNHVSKMESMGMSFIEDARRRQQGLQRGGDDNVVVLPAFGASLQEVTMFHDRNVQMVDTTCPWVSKVWDTVDKHKRGQFTSVIHGKYAHEETVATASYAGTYIVVKDMKEAHYVCDYILGGKLDGSSGTREEFLQASCSWLPSLLHVPILHKFAKAVSKGFDPDTDLDRLGIANQTTMLKGETEMIGHRPPPLTPHASHGSLPTLAISSYCPLSRTPLLQFNPRQLPYPSFLSLLLCCPPPPRASDAPVVVAHGVWRGRAGKLLERTMMSKFGATNVNSHFMSFNTICDATRCANTICDATQ